jgi:hypothetical protein
MTLAEHAEIVRRTLRNLERAVREHHAALAAMVAEHGEAAGLDPDLVAASVQPKDPPPENPEPEG